MFAHVTMFIGEPEIYVWKDDCSYAGEEFGVSSQMKNPPLDEAAERFKSNGKRKRKKQARKRMAAAVMVQSGARRRKAVKEAAAIRHAVITIQCILRCRLKRRRQAHEKELDATLNSNSTPGVRGVKQRWALRTAPSFQVQRGDGGEAYSGYSQAGAADGDASSRLARRPSRAAFLSPSPSYRLIAPTEELDDQAAAGAHFSAQFNSSSLARTPSCASHRRQASTGLEMLSEDTEANAEAASEIIQPVKSELSPLRVPSSMMPLQSFMARNPSFPSQVGKPIETSQSFTSRSPSFPSQVGKPIETRRSRSEDILLARTLLANALDHPSPLRPSPSQSRLRTSPSMPLPPRSLPPDLKPQALPPGYRVTTSSSFFDRIVANPAPQAALEPLPSRPMPTKFGSPTRKQAEPKAKSPPAAAKAWHGCLEPTAAIDEQEWGTVYMPTVGRARHLLPGYQTLDPHMHTLTMRAINEAVRGSKGSIAYSVASPFAMRKPILPRTFSSGRITGVHVH